MTNLPRGGGFILSARLPRGVKSHRSQKNGRWRKLVTLLDFRPENQHLVITISTISMRQNCSISFSAAQGGANKKILTFGPPPRYNYDVQSKEFCSQTTPPSPTPWGWGGGYLRALGAGPYIIILPTKRWVLGPGP